VSFSVAPKILDTASVGSGLVKVLLIHGTFARGASWTMPEHAFTRSVAKGLPSASIARLDWSGDNHHGVRLEASNAIVEWLNGLPIDCPVYLVGHSHGGTVAAMAATKSQRGGIQVITMSTPFIHAAPRNASLVNPSDRGSGESERGSYVGATLVLAAGAFALFAKAFGLEGLDVIWAISWSLLIVAVLLKLSSYKVEDDIEALRSTGVALAAQTHVDVPRDSLHIFRTPGDEASGMLAVSQMSAWLVQSIFRIFGRALYRLREVERLVGHCVAEDVPLSDLTKKYMWLYVVLQLVPLVGLAVILWLVARLHILSVVVEGCFIAILLPFTFLAYLPFGLDLARVAALLSVSAEPTPLGTWITHVRAADPRVLVAHSALYDTPVCAAYLIAHVLDIESAGRA
jgi:pimeloyl-ACP methyl ester carboxylesterase